MATDPAAAPAYDRDAGTFRAVDTTTGRTIHFLDRIYDGETVEVFESEEAAQDERGPRCSMRVVWTRDDWTLVAA